MVRKIGSPGNLVERQEVDVWIWAVHLRCSAQRQCAINLGVESQRPTSTAAAPPGAVWHGKCAVPPYPHFFVNVVIPKELFCHVGKRCHSKRFSATTFL